MAAMPRVDHSKGGEGSYTRSVVELLSFPKEKGDRNVFVSFIKTLDGGGGKVEEKRGGTQVKWRIQTYFYFLKSDLEKEVEERQSGELDSGGIKPQSRRK